MISNYRWRKIKQAAKNKGVVTYGARIPQNPKILGRSVKTEKGLSVGVLTAVAYLPPSTEAGYNTCPHATEQCSAVCLGSNIRS